MTEIMPPATKFTPLQHELLKIYSMNLSDDELREIKKLLSDYFWERLQNKVTLASEQMGYTQDDFDNWLNDPNQ